MTPEQVEAHDKPIALLRPSAVRKLVALLQPLSAVSGRLSLRRRYTREP